MGAAAVKVAAKAATRAAAVNLATVVAAAVEVAAKAATRAAAMNQTSVVAVAARAGAEAAVEPRKTEGLMAPAPRTEPPQVVRSAARTPCPRPCPHPTGSCVHA